MEHVSETNKQSLRPTSLSLLSIASASHSKAPSPADGSHAFSSRARPAAALSLNGSVLYQTFQPYQTNGIQNTQVVLQSQQRNLSQRNVTKFTVVRNLTGTTKLERET